MMTLRQFLAASFACLILVPPALAGTENCGIEVCPDGPLFGQHSESCIACGDPASTDGFPSASGALWILRAAVGLSPSECDGRECICDVNCDGEVDTTDALLALRRAVGQPVALNCCCPVVSCELPCTSAEFSITASEFDQGWTGIAHDAEWLRGAGFTVGIKRECTGNGAECERDEDCAGNGTCEPTCDCGLDTTCEITGPTHQRKCRNDLEDCTTNADCDPDVPCVHLFGPPLPLSSGGTPVCVVNIFDAPLTGTYDVGTGDTELSTALRMRVFHGIAIDRPCPRCGAPDQNPAIGDTFVCQGGQTNGNPCTVEGVTDAFGGTSSDCPPDLGAGISGTGLAVRLQQVTTGTTTKTAELPCKFFGFTGNPTVPGSNPKCIDKQGTGDPVCTSNADCMRCTEDVAVACTSNGDCTGNGVCAEAPDQPVTCGFWCNCGFCDNNPSLPCFETGDCPNGQTCVAGTGAANTANMGQQRPNDCSGDNFVCGGNVEEQCATTQRSFCSEAAYRTCEDDEDCANFDAGECQAEPRQCFESRITRSGTTSPLGSYCAFENKSCTSNADCNELTDYCVYDAARPETVALFCMPPTTTSGTNSASGITGPAALRLSHFVQICRCGDGSVGCDEACDDGNAVPGDGCDGLCHTEVLP